MLIGCVNRMNQGAGCVNRVHRWGVDRIHPQINTSRSDDVPGLVVHFSSPILPLASSRAVHKGFNFSVRYLSR